MSGQVDVRAAFRRIDTTTARSHVHQTEVLVAVAQDPVWTSSCLSYCSA
jgi:hypothetical protein